MSQINVDDIVQMVAIVGTASGTVGSLSALVVDFYRRRVRAKAAEYAAASDFMRITNAVDLLQRTLDGHMSRSLDKQIEIVERLSHVEGQVNALRNP